jgi:hypothetical protein
VDVDAEIGRLYELPPGEFVAARDELWRRLRAQPSNRAAAERVRALRRPTVAAWAVNQVARRHAELVAELVEAGERLHQAQRRALSGLRDSGLRAASAERRERLDRLLAAASRVLVEAGRPPDPHRDAIAATFEAASVDPEAAAAVRGGTLARELDAPTGFGEVSGLELLRPPEPAAEPAGKAAKPPAGRRGRVDAARRRQLEAARRQQGELRRKARESDRVAAEAREAAERADQEADSSAQTAQRLAEEARRARRAAEDARRAAEEARREAEIAKDNAQRAQRRSRAAADRAGKAEAAAWSARDALEAAERQIADLESAE